LKDVILSNINVLLYMQKLINSSGSSRQVNGVLLQDAIVHLIVIVFRNSSNYIKLHWSHESIVKRMMDGEKIHLNVPSRLFKILMSCRAGALVSDLKVLKYLPVDVMLKCCMQYFMRRSTVSDYFPSGNNCLYYHHRLIKV